MKNIIIATLIIMATLAVGALFTQSVKATAPAGLMYVCSAYVVDDACDYTADGISDQVEIQNAINAVSPGKVSLSGGTFYVDATINLQSGTVLEGQGVGTVIFVQNGANISHILSVVGAPDAAVRSLKINGNKAQQSSGTGIGIRIGENSPHVTIESISLLNTVGNGISMYGANGKGSVVRDSAIEGAGNYGIYVYQVDTQIINNVVQASVNSGLFAGQANGLIVTGNIMKDTGRTGIELFNSNNVVIANNVTKNNTFLGIVLTGSQGVVVADNRTTLNGNNGIDCNNSQNVAITGNVSSYNGSAAYEGNGILAWRCQNVTITGNVTFNNGQGQPLNRDGIRVSDDAVNPGRHVVIVGNRSFDNQASPTQGYGIRIGGPMSGMTVNNIIIQGNDVQTNGLAGITLDGLVASPTIIISGNMGYVTEAKGFAAVEDGTTNIVVTHGMAIKPSAANCAVNANSNMGNSNKFWVNSFTATTFQINVDVDPGAGRAVFAWNCRSY